MGSVKPIKEAAPDSDVVNMPSQLSKIDFLRVIFLFFKLVTFLTYSS